MTRENKNIKVLKTIFKLFIKSGKLAGALSDIFIPNLFDWDRNFAEKMVRKLIKETKLNFNINNFSNFRFTPIYYIMRNYIISEDFKKFLEEHK